MALVVVGGHTRNIGKTSVVAGLIAALPELNWTAFKITQFGHGVCSANGEPCDCETADHTLAISQERDFASGTDSSRYLAAGAARSFWVRTRQGQLAAAMPRLRREFAQSENTIVESNSILRFVRPDLFLSVLDAGTADFKPSAKHYLDRAQGIILTGGGLRTAAWPEVSLKLIAHARVFHGQEGAYCSPELVEFVRKTVELARTPSTPELQRDAASTSSTRKSVVLDGTP